MTIYFVNVALVVLYAILFLRKSNGLVPDRRKRIFLILAFGQMILIQSLRDMSVGIDMYSYVDKYFSITGMSWDYIFSNLIRLTKRGELLFLFYQKIILDIFHSPQMFIAITSVFVLTPIAIFIYKYAEDVFVPTLMFITLGLFTFTFSGLRQSMAISILLMSIPLIKKRKLIPFILLCIIARYFHSSALFFIPSYFLYQLRFDKKIFISWIVILFLAIYFAPILSNYIVTFLYEEYVLKTNIGISGLFIMNFAILIICYFFAWRKNIDKDNNFLFSMSFFYILIIAFSGVSAVASRAGMTHSLFFYLLVSYTINKIKSPIVRSIVIVLLCVICIMLYPRYYMGLGIVPYIPIQ